MIDYYNLLGVTPEATPAELKRAFRAQAKRSHPDAHPGLPPAEAEAMRRRFILLAQAYETLTHPLRRERYHRQWQASRPQGASAGGSASPGAGPWRSTRAGFRSGRRSAAGGEARFTSAGGEGEGLEDLLREVESLLGRFGLGLRQPFEELLEALLEWARAVFRQVAEAWDAAGEEEPPPQRERPAGPRPAQGAGRATTRSGTDRARADDRAGDRAKNRAKNRAGSGGRPGSRARAHPDVEAELRALKEKLGGRPRARGPEADSPQDVEAELRRLKRKLGREG
jgi:curved DNA-binding protein CbpA